MSLLYSILKYLCCCFYNNEDHTTSYRYQQRQQQERQPIYGSTAGYSSTRTSKYRSSTSSFETNNHQNGKNRPSSSSSSSAHTTIGIATKSDADRNLPHYAHSTSTRTSPTQASYKQILSTSKPVKPSQKLDASNKHRSQLQTNPSISKPVQSSQKLDVSSIHRSQLQTNPSTSKPVQSSQKLDVSNVHRSQLQTSPSILKPVQSSQKKDVSNVHLSQPQTSPSTSKPVQSSQKNDVSNTHQSQLQINISTPSVFNTSHRDQPTNLLSTQPIQEGDLVLTKLKKKWDAEMQMDNFIRSKTGSLPQLRQDLFNTIIQNCHQAIENYLTPRWSTTLAKYTRIIPQERGNKSNFNSTSSDKVKQRRLENQALLSCLKVYIMQKVCFDQAVLSCFNEIVNEYKKSHDDDNMDLRHNQTEQDIMDKINLEIQRLHIGLSIYANRYEIQQQVNNNQVVIIKGQTGCGKSTQIPQYIAELSMGKVICTQPTNIAAIGLADHLNQEYTHISSSVNYKVNHSSLYQESHNDSIITFVTDSLLLDILVDDPNLSSYSCVIIDQAHQRSLNTDILLAFLKQAIARRYDLRLIIISASVDTKLFSHYFNQCPTVKVSGKLFPVDIKWCNDHINNYLDKALDTVVEIHNRGEKGDILVFLVTPDETEKACKELKKRFSNNPDSLIALSLHDHLQDTDLRKIFMIDSNRRRKVIFAANCAEISITIPGICYIIDTGLVKERIYDDKSNCYTLQIHPICQSSARQRCNHAGRTQSGICYRLYSRKVYNNMSKSPEPEIKHADISNAILKMIELGITDVANFNFLQSPSPQNIIDSLDYLHMLSAIATCTSPLSLTSKGKLFCQLPLEPRLSAFITDAMQWNILPEGILIASALSISCHLQCCYGSEENNSDLEVTGTQFCRRDGDVISTAAVYAKWRSLNKKEERKNWCFKNRVNRKLMKRLDYKVRELEQSLRYLDIIDQSLMIPSQLAPQSGDELRRLIFKYYHDRLAIFTGLDKIGYITACSDYQHLIHKSSTLFSSGSNPKFIIYQEILTTWDHFLINVTLVDEEWLQFIDDNCAKIESLVDNVAVAQTINNLGSIVFSELDTNNIDKLVKDLLQDENIRCNIIRNVKDSSLEVTTIKSKMPRALDIINQSIMQKKEKLVKAIKILSNEDNHACRLIIGRGIIVKDILLPSDCTEFNITLSYTGNGSPNKSCTTAAINEARALIMSYGELAVDIDNIGVKKSKDYKYIRFDKIIYQQISSQSSLKEIDNRVISRYEINIENGSLANCSISQDRILVQFRWPRRPRNGKGSIICRDHIAAINIRNSFPLTIHNHIIYASIDRHCDHKLFLRQIPNFISDSDLRLAIPLVNREAITKIYFHRAALSIDNEICSSELESTLSDILIQNGFIGMYSKITIKPISSIEKHQNVVADVIFDTYDAAVSAAQDLNNGVYEELIDEPISVRLSHSRSIRCQREIYDCVATEIEQIQESAKNIKDDQKEIVHIFINPSSKKYPSTLIVIRSWNELRVYETLRQIGKIIEPVKLRIDDSEIFEYLNTKDRKTILTSLNRRFAVYATTDWRSQCILIYGIKENKGRALHYCQENINRLLSRCKIIDLAGNNKPKGLIKAIIKRYGNNFTTLLQSSGADEIRLNWKNKTLTVIGKKQSFAYVSNKIDLCCNTLNVSKEKSSNQISANICVLCFCEVDNDYYRLQYCGHLYCQECIENQIENTIKSSSLPLNCASCNEGFVIEDLERLLVKSPQPRLFDVLLTEFVRRHSTEWHYCPTPGCESVYKRSDSYEVFTCSRCQKKTCRGCDTDVHPGYDCDQINLIRNCDGSFEKYLNENSHNDKKCPNCKIAIEKVYGCHHMECTFCHTNFCWICLARFTTPRECYGHLLAVHGSFV